jgi:Protein of unknown function (DUF2848)
MLRLAVVGDDRDVEIEPRRLVIAGYTGRDEAMVRRHIQELAQIGVPPPETIPAFYPVPATLLTTAGAIEVANDSTSGEVEPVLFCVGDEWFIGLGSDHTARDVERESIALSKAACPKPIAARVLPYDRVAAGWDRLRLRSWVGGAAPYQDAPISGLRPPAELVDAYRAGTDADLEGLVMFLGTVPVVDGALQSAPTFRAELLDGDDVLLSLTYAIRVTRRG